MSGQTDRCLNNNIAESISYRVVGVGTHCITELFVSSLQKHILVYVAFYEQAYTDQCYWKSL